MHPARIAELLEPFLDAANGQRLTTDDLTSISTYVDILLRWNARINLTAIRDPEDIVPRHFGESLFAARHLFPRDPSVPLVSSVVKDFHSVADLGSGAGFPGIPLKLWAPQISLTLIEANHKKATFLREVTRSLTLTDIDIKNARAESLAGLTFNLVTLRAVESFAAILPIAASLVAPAGRLALLIGSSQVPAATSVSAFTWLAPVQIPLTRARVLLIGNRV